MKCPCTKTSKTKAPARRTSRRNKSIRRSCSKALRRTTTTTRTTKRGGRGKRSGGNVGFNFDLSVPPVGGRPVFVGYDECSANITTLS